jgi:hypothetical protein
MNDRLLIRFKSMSEINRSAQDERIFSDVKNLMEVDHNL